VSGSTIEISVLIQSACGPPIVNSSPFATTSATGNLIHSLLSASNCEVVKRTWIMAVILSVIGRSG
jgi:hypothetical protein